MRMRTAAGFLIAPLVVPVGVILMAPREAASFWDQALEVLVWGLIWYFYALLFALVLALPLYLALNRFNLVRWWVALGAGLFVGVIAALAISNGQSAEECGKLVIFGGISGIVFWVIVKYKQQSQELGNNAT